MKSFNAILCFVVLSLAAAQPPYKYPSPPLVAPPQVTLPPAPLPVRQSGPAPHFRPQGGPSSSGIYSSVQSLPLAQFNLNSEVPQQAPAPILAPAPVAQPGGGYLPPQQQQQQQIFSGTAQLSLPIASVPQSHQQQIVQQQFGGGFQQPIQQTFQQSFQSFQRPQTAIITKDIYIHSAPEDQEESALGQQLDNAPIRKNYRIVFIKAPSQNLKLAAAALKRAQSSNEEKTVIYVLSKKPDLSEVHQQLQQAQGQQKANKPEVYFIKYKTQEEAQRAQQEIQAQYDSLGGSTHISDEGVAPIASVIGGSSGGLNLGGPISSGGSSSFVQQSYQSQSIGGSSSLGISEVPSQKYLPVVKK